MKKIVLTKGMCATVDDDDYNNVAAFNWFAVKMRHKWYAVRNSKGNSIPMHRVIISAPPGAFVDHIDGDGLNNSKDNLRLCTMSQNLSNRGKQTNNTTGYKGVTFNKRAGKYQSQIKLNQKMIYLGCYQSAEDAARSYDEAAKKYHGEFANLNFPDTP